MTAPQTPWKLHLRKQSGSKREADWIASEDAEGNLIIKTGPVGSKPKALVVPKETLQGLTPYAEAELRAQEMYRQKFTLFQVIPPDSAAPPEPIVHFSTISQGGTRDTVVELVKKWQQEVGDDTLSLDPQETTLLIRDVPPVGIESQHLVPLASGNRAAGQVYDGKAVLALLFLLKGTNNAVIVTDRTNALLDRSGIRGFVTANKLLDGPLREIAEKSGVIFNATGGIQTESDSAWF